MLKSYPQIRWSPHQYLSLGSVLKFPSNDGRAALILKKTDALRILANRGGLEPSVNYMERCS